jgi:hypothetical protein
VADEAAKAAKAVPDRRQADYLLAWLDGTISGCRGFPDP